MLYSFLKIYVRLGMLIICRKITINNPSLLRSRGPLLLACNHPNSFLDAVILDVLFDRPIWSLARGDVFRKKWIARMLYAMKIFPVYRSSEGVENLSGNYETFAECIRLFREEGVVLIFSEGKCINEWHLRPLRKGTARLAVKAWEDNIPLQVLPVGINYSSFRRFGKNMFINFGNLISADVLDGALSDGQKNAVFNKRLRAELESLVYEIGQNDKDEQHQQLSVAQHPLKKIVLFLPAIAGLLLHAPLYLPVRQWVRKKFNHNDHYDSMIGGVLILSYPVYLVILLLIAFWLWPSPWIFAGLLVLPFCAWAYVQLKPQLDK